MRLEIAVLNLASLGMQGVIDRTPKGPCPRCGLKVSGEELVCPHCGYELSDMDREFLRTHLKTQHKKGVRLGVMVFPCVIVLLVIAFYLK